MVNEEEQEDPNSIPDYLEKVFKQKEEDKFKRRMMGDDIDIKDRTLSNDTDEVKYIDTEKLKNKKMENSYM